MLLVMFVPMQKLVFGLEQHFLCHFGFSFHFLHHFFLRFGKDKANDGQNGGRNQEQRHDSVGDGSLSITTIG
jgi:hypothetical protein